MEIDCGSLRSLNFSAETPTEISPGPFTTPSPARHPAPGPACRCARARSLRHLSPHPPASWCCPADCSFLCLDTAPVFLSPSDPSWGACVRVLFLIVRNFFSTVWAGDSLFPPQLSPLSFIYFILRFSPFPSPTSPLSFFSTDTSFFLFQFHRLSCPLSPFPFPYLCALLKIIQ